MEYPPTTSYGGPYIRDYSQQGVNAAFGVAYPPCDAFFNAYGDTGNMYFNAWAGNNGPSGSQTDAGIAANAYPNRDPNNTDVFADVLSGGTYDPSQVSGSFVNTYESWPCGEPLVILCGEVTPPGAGHTIGEIFARKVSNARQATRTRRDRAMDRAA